MLKYLVKRLLIFIPTMFAITLIAFVIMIYTPGDPVADMMEYGNFGDALAGERAGENEYLAMRRKLGLDKPVFYFSVTSLAEPKDLFEIARPDERAAAKALVYEYGNWEKIKVFFDHIRSYRNEVLDFENGDLDLEELIVFKRALTEICVAEDPDLIPGHISAMDSIYQIDPAAYSAVASGFEELKLSYGAMVEEPTTWRIYVPAFRWYGFENQYHNWLGNLMTLDFGKSYNDQTEVSSKIPTAMKWTFIISLVSVILVYLISLPTGIYTAVFKDTLGERTVSSILFILYSLPAFWVGTLLIMFLCNPHYLELFPAYGVQSRFSQEWPFWNRLLDWVWHLALPTLCFTYGSLAFLSRQMRVGMLEFISSDFIRTARAKGLPEKKVIMKHAFRNSLIPIVTLFGGILPALVTGSIIIEEIFSVPGMGFESIFAYRTRDYPMIIAIFTILGVLTQLGILLSDLLYAWVDPRISFATKK